MRCVGRSAGGAAGRASIAGSCSPARGDRLQGTGYRGQVTGDSGQCGGRGRWLAGWVRAASAGGPSCAAEPRLHPPAPPPGSHYSPTSPKTAGGGWGGARCDGSAKGIELRPAGGPSPGPSPFVPHGEGRIRSRSEKPVERVTSPARSLRGRGRERGGHPPSRATHPKRPARCNLSPVTCPPIPYPLKTSTRPRCSPPGTCTPRRRWAKAG
jgi:hypothetical protein